MAEALAGLLELGRLLGNGSSNGARPSGAAGTMGQQVCYQFRDFGRCSRGDACRFLHAGGCTTFTGPSELKSCGSFVEQMTHGASQLKDPNSKSAFMMIRLIERKEVVEALMRTDNDTLLNRVVPVSAGMHDAVCSLLLLLSPDATKNGQPVTVEGIKSVVSALVATLEQDGWRPALAKDPVTDTSAELRENMAKLTSVVEKLAVSVEHAYKPSAVEKRSGPTRLSTVVGDITSMSVDERAAVTNALMGDRHVLPPSAVASPAHKVASLGERCVLSPQPNIATVASAAVPYDEFDEEAEDNAPSRCLVQHSAVSYQSHKEIRGTIHYNVDAPQDTPVLAPYCGPHSLKEPAVAIPDAAALINFQGRDLRDMCMGLTDTFVCALLQCQRPCTRLTGLLHTFGVDYSADGRSPLATALLLVMVARKSKGMACTPTSIAG